MDKARFKARLLDLVRECLPFEHTARVTLLMSVRMDDRPDALSVDVSEELTRPGAAGGARGSKRKSQAPQRMVPTGEDSFVPAPRAAPAAAGDASSSFNADLSDEDQQPLNLSSRQGSPTAAATGASAAASTPLKPPSAAFRLNNPDLPPLTFHFGVSAAPVAKQQLPQLQDAPAAVARAASPTGAGSSNAAAAAAAAAVIAGAAAAPNGQQQPKQLLEPQPLQQRRPLGMRSRRPGNRSFPCNQCGDVFQSLAGLSKHTFTQHKVYKCTFCGANFTQRSNLQRHSLKHVGFKPFECRCCRKSYYRKDHLVRHIEVTHPGHDPKLSIDTRLSSAECLQYLERKHESRDYTSLSGVVLSAAEAAAAAAEGAAAGGAASSADGCEEADEEEQLMMLDGEGDMDEEAEEEAEETLGEYEEDGAMEADEEAEEEIDVGRDDQQQQHGTLLMEQPVAE